MYLHRRFDEVREDRPGFRMAVVQTEPSPFHPYCLGPTVRSPWHAQGSPRTAPRCDRTTNGYLPGSALIRKNGTVVVSEKLFPKPLVGTLGPCRFQPA